MARDSILEQFFSTLITGQRDEAKAIVDELVDAETPAQRIVTHLFWPALEHVQSLHRNDQLADVAFHYATRLLRLLVAHMELRYERGPNRDKKVLVVCGPEESEEIAAQITADLLDADGYDVFFCGGGIANDEIVAQIGELNIDALVMFGDLPTTVPYTRLLIDRIHDIGLSKTTQVIVGGGVFNRADGLAEEIGADLWAKSPEDIVAAMDEHPDRRMASDQRTVGKRTRTRRSSSESEAA